MCLKPWNVKLQQRINLQNVLTVLRSVLGGRSKRVQRQCTSSCPCKAHQIPALERKGTAWNCCHDGSAIQVFNAWHNYTWHNYGISSSKGCSSNALLSNAKPWLPCSPPWPCACVGVWTYVMHGAICYTCACTLASGGRTWGQESTRLRVTELGNVPCAEPCHRPGHLGCFTAPLIGSELREIWVWEWHWQGTYQKLRLRLLPSNVNRGQRHRELSAINNTRAWNRNTHKAYGINTTKEDLRTFSVPSL